MSKKEELRVQRINTVINKTSKKQENDLLNALNELVQKIDEEFSVRLFHEGRILLSEITNKLKELFPEEEIAKPFPTSSMRPDGGILYLLDKADNKYPILITEVKNQGTNDLRAQEGKPRQAQGNAIERLGKNVIGFRTFLLDESIFPFVTFGYGCDFADGSSILDRVLTINMFGKLNKTNVYNTGVQESFNRGSFYFREDRWNKDEMISIMYDIAKKSIYYYFSKYGEEKFV